MPTSLLILTRKSGQHLQGATKIGIMTLFALRPGKAIADL